jgi:hypothetical protein
MAKEYPNLGVRPEDPTPGDKAKAKVAEVRDNVKQWWQDLRIGDGHATGMARLGGHEVTQALAAFPDSTIRPMDEPGVFGNATAQIVTEEMGKSFTDTLEKSARPGRDDPDREGMSR